MIVLLLALASAEPFGGLLLRPLSRADLVWVDEDRTSGEGVGEFDGVVRPSLQPYIGAWLGDRVAVLGSLGIAHISTRTYVGDTVWRRAHTVVRPSADIRYALRKESPRVWAAASFHTDIPSAIDRSNGYSEEEQQAASDAASTTRARLAGVGGALGLGAEVQLHPNVSVGLQYRIELHHGSMRDTAAVTTSNWLASDAGLLLTLHLPRPSPPATGEQAQ